MNERTARTASRYNISDTVKNLEKDLLSLDGISKIEFDLDGFYDSMRQVIILIHYDIRVDLDNYYKIRTDMLEAAKEIAKEKYGLKRTPDKVEDYGTCLYVVFEYDKNNELWEKNKS